MRGYDEQFTIEIFKISYRFRQRGYRMYRIVDFLDEKVKGNFYEHELQSVEKKYREFVANHKNHSEETKTK